MDAAALVVGIDDYAALPKLSGCATDALDAADWLVSIGVPSERIRLHVASAQAIAAPAGVVVQPARRDDIWGSILDIKAESGERLFVFLSGHGYYLAEAGPIFLAQDWSRGFSSKNLDIESYADFFQGLKFKDTLFVVDACQNYDMDPIYRSGIEPSKPDDKKVLPDPDRGVLLCCAAAQGQYAPVVNGRGLLTRKLLAVLREAPRTIPRDARGAYVYHWRTGTAKLDLWPLFKFVVAPWVTEAAKNEGHTQTPTMQERGRLRTEWRFMVQDLPALDTVPLRVAAEPLEGLDMITVQLRPPVQELELPLTTPPPMPFEGVAPVGRRLVAQCMASAGWKAVPEIAEIPAIAQSVDLRFDLHPLPPDPSRDSFNLKLITGTGADAYEVSGGDYQAAVTEPVVAKLLKAGRLLIEPHENGPDIAVRDISFGVAETAVRRIRDVLSARLRERLPEAELVVTPPGRDWERFRPNLRLLLPEGGAPALVGYLGSEPLIRIERIGRGDANPVKRLTADRLADRAWLRLHPAAYRIVVDVPWGMTSVVVDLDEEPQSIVRLPIPVGQPPLRNAFAHGELLGPASSEWAIEWVSPQEAAIPSPPGLVLLTGRRGDRIRAEPFSELPWVEWDLLLGAGRLDAVNLDAASERISAAKEAHPALDVLRIALAYAAWAQRRPERIQGFLRDLSPAYELTTDAQLLRMEAEDDSTSEKLPGPYFRWGVQLLNRRAPNTELPGEPSPFSVWSVYESVTESEPEPQQRAAAA